MTASIPFCILCQIHLAELRGWAWLRGWVWLGVRGWDKNSAQNCPQNRPKIVSKITAKTSPKSAQNRPQNRPKIGPKITPKTSPKSSQNRPKIVLKIVPKLFQNRGWVWEGMDGRKWATCIPPGYLFCDRVLKEYWSSCHLSVLDIWTFVTS